MYLPSINLQDINHFLLVTIVRAPTLSFPSLPHSLEYAANHLHAFQTPTFHVREPASSFPDRDPTTTIAHARRPRSNNLYRGTTSRSIIALHAPSHSSTILNAFPTVSSSPSDQVISIADHNTWMTQAEKDMAAIWAYTAPALGWWHFCSPPQGTDSSRSLRSPERCHHFHCHRNHRRRDLWSPPNSPPKLFRVSENLILAQLQLNGMRCWQIFP